MFRPGEREKSGISFGVPWFCQEPSHSSCSWRLWQSPVGCGGGDSDTSRAWESPRARTSVWANILGVVAPAGVLIGCQGRTSTCKGSVPARSCPGGGWVAPGTFQVLLTVGAGTNFGVWGDTSPSWSRCQSQGAQGRAHPPAPAPQGGGEGSIGARSCFASAAASPGEPLLPGNAAPRGEASPKSAGRCWCQPGRDQACHQRVCVGGLIFVCRSQMVKEESDIIPRAGAMKRGGEKVTGGSKTPGAPQLWGGLALQLCFLQGSIPGFSGNHSHIQTSFLLPCGYTGKLNCEWC